MRQFSLCFLALRTNKNKHQYTWHRTLLLEKAEQKEVPHNFWESNKKMTAIFAKVGAKTSKAISINYAFLIWNSEMDCIVGLQNSTQSPGIAIVGRAEFFIVLALTVSARTNEITKSRLRPCCCQRSSHPQRNYPGADDEKKRANLGTDCILNVRITNLDTSSNINRKPGEKKRKYLQACLDQRLT